MKRPQYRNEAPINVLSLFDGISCGLEALKRARFNVGNYYASEVDKWAIQISKKNHPEIIHLGDVTKWREWELPRIDMIIGGSPCQGFSFAGKQLNFDDPRSALFFEFVNCVEHFKPRWFLLENVKMKKEYQDVISGLMKHEPVLINSALLSAQNRKRLYWCNWEVPQPVDKGILLRDVIENQPGTTIEKRNRHGKLKSNQDKASCFTAGGHSGGNHSDMDIIHFVDRDKSFPIIGSIGRTTPREYFERSQGQLVFVGGIEKGRRLHDGKNLSRNFREGSRIYSEDGKAATLTNQSKGGLGGYSGLYDIKNSYRKLTPIECERLQTLPDNYTEGVSNTQRYKALGNSWTCDVISHILEYIPYF